MKTLTKKLIDFKNRVMDDNMSGIDAALLFTGIVMAAVGVFGYLANALTIH